jgi:hypothetical protein
LSVKGKFPEEGSVNLTKLEMEVTRKSDYLVFTVTGKYNLHEAIERFPMVLAACRQTGLSRALIDYRDLEVEAWATQDILYAQGVGDYYKQYLSTGGGAIRVAFLAPEPRPWQDGEAIAEGYGLDALTTTDYNQALNWLFREEPNDEIYKGEVHDDTHTK